MKDGGCTKHYPKTFHDSISIDGDGYPLYCRRNDIGHGYETRGHLVDNQNVVLYNPFLFWKYSCEINIEV